MPLPVVVTVVVFLLLIAASCSAIAIWTILHDLRARRIQTPFPQAPPRTFAASPVVLRPPVLPAAPMVAPRRLMPPGVPLLPPPLPRGFVLGTLAPERDEDEDDEHDYTEVEDGVTTVRTIGIAARR